MPYIYTYERALASFSSNQGCLAQVPPKNTNLLHQTHSHHRHHAHHHPPSIVRLLWTRSLLAFCSYWGSSSIYRRLNQLVSFVASGRLGYSVTPCLVIIWAVLSSLYFSPSKD